MRSPQLPYLTQVMCLIVFCFSVFLFFCFFKFLKFFIFYFFSLFFLLQHLKNKIQMNRIYGHVTELSKICPPGILKPTKFAWPSPLSTLVKYGRFMIKSVNETCCSTTALTSLLTSALWNLGRKKNKKLVYT